MTTTLAPRDPAPGDRVRMVQTISMGIVVGEPHPSEVDGSPRIPVRWKNSGVTTGWSAEFLRPADTDPANDPDEVRVGPLVRRRGRMYLDEFDTIVIVPDGFFRAPADQDDS